jgi:hypothetical protein
LTKPSCRYESPVAANFTTNVTCAVFAAEGARSFASNIWSIGLSAVPVDKLAQLSLCRDFTQNALKYYTSDI